MEWAILTRRVETHDMMLGMSSSCWG